MEFVYLWCDLLHDLMNCTVFFIWIWQIHDTFLKDFLKNKRVKWDLFQNDLALVLFLVCTEKLQVLGKNMG